MSVRTSPWILWAVGPVGQLLMPNFFPNTSIPLRLNGSRAFQRFAFIFRAHVFRGPPRHSGLHASHFYYLR